MTNKKSLLQDSLQELENIKNESLELAKEQLINESADLLEKKSAALFEKLISEETEGFTLSEEETVQEKDESLDEILSELKKSEEMYDSDEEEDDSDEEDYDEDEMDSDEEPEEDDEEEIDDSDEEEIDDSDEEEDDSDEEEDDSDEEEDDSDEEEIDDSDEEDIEFGDDDEESDDDEIDSDEEDGDFVDVDVDDKVLAEAFSNKKNNKSMNESFKRNNTKMRNTKKQVLKDLRDVSFNRLVEAYYNMDENDSFIIKENENPYMEEDNYEEGYEHTMMDEDLFDEDFDVHGGVMDEDLFEDEGEDVYHKDVYRSGGMSSEKPSMRTAPDGSRYSYEKMGRDTIMKDYPSSEEEMFEPQDEETIYEVEMPEESWNMHETMTDEEVSRMLDEMDGESYEKPSRKLNRTMHDVEEASGMVRMQPSELEEMFNEMTTEELMEMSSMLEDEGGSLVDVDPRADYGMEEDYSTLSEDEIQEMIDSMNEGDFEDQMEEGIAISTQTRRDVGPGKKRGGEVQGRPERRSGMIAEEGEMMEGGEEQLDEFWGGAKSVLGKVATDIGKLGSSAKQAVGQYADQLQKQYNSAEVGTETKKLERIAANLGLQIDNLDKRLVAAGKGKLDKIAMITSLANQMRSNSGKGVVNVANISNFQKANQTQAQPQGQAQGQPMQEDGDYTLQEQVKKLKQENKALNEGFTNKVKSLENKVYDVTISALKAGFVNKFLLEHPLRENEKLQIIHRFSNAQTKEQIKETYISLTNEFAKGQTVKDGSMLNESVQNKVGKVHRTDNAVVREKNLINENDESLRFKQLLNYNFGKKK